MTQRISAVQQNQQQLLLNGIKKNSNVQNVGQQVDQLTYNTQLTYEQKENIKLLSSKFVNKYVKARKRNYSTLFWNLRVITIRDNKFQFYKIDKKYDELSIQELKIKEENRLRLEGDGQMQQVVQQMKNQQEDQGDKMEILPEILRDQPGLLIKKGEVLMTDIIRVQWPSDEQAEDPKQKLIIHFAKNKMTLYDSNQNPIRRENEKGEAYWMFELGNFMRDDHRERIEREKRLEEDKKKKERKKQEEEEKKKKDLQDKKKTAEQREEEQRKLEDEEKNKVKMEQEEKQQEEMTKRQRETSQQNQEEKQKNQDKTDKLSMKRDEKILESARKKFEYSYEFYYNLIWEEQIDLFKANIDDGMVRDKLNNMTFELNMKLIEVVGFINSLHQNNFYKTQPQKNYRHFRRKCSSTFRNIVTQMILPSSLQQYKKVEPTSKLYSQWLWLKEEGEDLYIVNNIIFRVAKFHFSKNENQDVSFNDYTLKSINNEFRANRILSDILFNLRRECLTQLQIPLTCVVEFLGFKALCIAIPPIANFEPVLGPNYQNDTSNQQQKMQVNKQNSMTPTDQGQQPNQPSESDRQVVYKEEPSLDEDLSRVGKIINLKSFTFKSKEKVDSSSTNDKKKKIENSYKDVKIHLSIFHEIYEMKETPQWLDTIKQLQKNILYMDSQGQDLGEQINYRNDENCSFQNIIKILTAQLNEKDELKKPEHKVEIEDDIKWLDLIQRIIKNHKKSIINYKGKRSEMKYYYIMKNSNLFPVMFQGKLKQFDFSKQFRPEFLFDYTDIPLSNGAFINSSTSKNEISDDEKNCAEYSKSIVELMIPQLIQKLENLQILIYDSKSISKAFHSFGVNLRFMGVTHKMTNFPHIKDLLLVEMIARSIKKIYRWWMASAIDDIKKENERSYDLQNNGKQREDKDKDDGEEAGEDMTIINQKPFLISFENQIIKYTLDFLNLIFGFIPSQIVEQPKTSTANQKNDVQEINKSKETRDFWNNWIAPQVLADFDFNIGTFPQNLVIAQGTLLNSVLYNLRIKMQYEINSLQLFTSTEPFDKNKITHICFSKYYDFVTLPLRQYSQKWKLYRQGSDPILIQKSLLLDLKIEETLKDKNNSPHITTDEFMILTDLMENSFKRACAVPRQKSSSSNQKVDYYSQVQWYLAQAINYGEAIKEIGSNCIIGFAKYYIMMMKISYNKMVFFEKQKRQIEKDILRIIKNNKFKEVKLSEIDLLIDRLNNQDPSKQAIASAIKDAYNTLNKIKKEIENLHPDSIKFFEKALEVVRFNLGEYHFLFASLYCQCKDVQKAKDQSIYTLLLSALTCCNRILGNNHIQTAEVCQDLSEFIYNFNDKKHSESLHYYEKALLIYEAVYGSSSFKVANMCYQLGRRYQKLGYYQKVIDYCQRSYKVFCTDEITYYQSCVECCILICKATDILRLDDQQLQYLQKIWDTLEKYSLVDNEESLEKFTFVIQQVVKIFFTKLSYKKKNYMFKFLLAFKYQDEENQNRTMVNQKRLELHSQAQVKQAVQTQGALNTILKKSKDEEGAFDQHTYCMSVLAQTKPSETFRIISDKMELTDYQVKYAESKPTLPNKKVEPQQKKVLFDLKESKDDQSISFKVGFINTKKREEHKEEFLLVSNSIISKCREMKSVTRAIKWLLNCFMGQFNFINYRQNFFFNFAENIEHVINPDKEINKTKLSLNLILQIFYIPSINDIFVLLNSNATPGKAIGQKGSEYEQEQNQDDEQNQFPGATVLNNRRYDYQFRDALILFDELVMLLGEDFFNNIFNKTYSDEISDDEDEDNDNQSSLIF